MEKQRSDHRTRTGSTKRRKSEISIRMVYEKKFRRRRKIKRADKTSAKMYEVELDNNNNNEQKDKMMKNKN